MLRLMLYQKKQIRDYDLMGLTIAIVIVRELNSGGEMHIIPGCRCDMCIFHNKLCYIYHFKIERKR